MSRNQLSETDVRLIFNERVPPFISFTTSSSAAAMFIWMCCHDDMEREKVLSMQGGPSYITYLSVIRWTTTTNKTVVDFLDSLCARERTATVAVSWLTTILDSNTATDRATFTKTLPLIWTAEESRYHAGRMEKPNTRAFRKLPYVRTYIRLIRSLLFYYCSDHRQL